MSSFGLDHVKLRSKDFQVRDASLFQHNPGVTKYGQEPEVWGYSAQGQPLTGKSIFVNRGQESQYPCTVEVSPYGLKVEFNPSTLQHSHNLTTSLQAPVEAVKDTLQALQVDVCLDSMHLGRVDVTKQKQMDKPFHSFAPALSALSGRRMKATAYPDGYRVGNGSRQAIFYDKGLQMKTQKQMHVDVGNLLRAEARFQNGKAIGSTNSGLGLGTFRDLQAVDTDYLHHHYTRFMQRDIFKLDASKQMKLDFGAEADVLAYLLSQEKTPSKAVQRYVYSCGVDGLLDHFKTLDNFRRTLLDLGVAERSTRRLISGLQDSLYEKGKLDLLREQNTSTAATLDLLARTFAA